MNILDIWWVYTTFVPEDDTAKIILRLFELCILKVNPVPKKMMYLLVFSQPLYERNQWNKSRGSSVRWSDKVVLTPSRLKSSEGGKCSHDIYLSTNYWSWKIHENKSCSQVYPESFVEETVFQTVCWRSGIYWRICIPKRGRVNTPTPLWPAR